MDRRIRSLRALAPVTPSNPNPKYRESAVLATDPSSYARWVRTQSFPLNEPVGAPLGVQPPLPSSNDVVSAAPPRVTVTSSSRTPGISPNDQSEISVIETSTCLPAKAPRSTCHCSYPDEPPLAAFHVPVVPPGVHTYGSASVPVPVRVR